MKPNTEGHWLSSREPGKEGFWIFFFLISVRELLFRGWLLYLISRSRGHHFLWRLLPFFGEVPSPFSSINGRQVPTQCPSRNGDSSLYLHVCATERHEKWSLKTHGAPKNRRKIVFPREKFILNYQLSPPPSPRALRTNIRGAPEGDSGG